MITVAWIAGTMMSSCLRASLTLGSMTASNERVSSMWQTIAELRMDDRVIPDSSDARESGKTLTVTDLHPDTDGVTVAVTLWDGWREHTSWTTLYNVVKRYWY